MSKNYVEWNTGKAKANENRNVVWQEAEIDALTNEATFLFFQIVCMFCFHIQ